MDSLVQILFVDDERGNFGSVQQRLVALFADLRCTAKLEYVADPDEACEKIGNRPSPYEVVIADLLFATNGTQDARGIDVIEKAKRVSPDTVIVAITQGDGDERLLEFMARKASADIVLLRAQLLRRSPYGGLPQLVHDIYSLICNRGLIEAGPQLTFENEPGIEAVLHDTDPGGATLRLLIADLLANGSSEPSSANIAYNAPGASGAHVVRIIVGFESGARRAYLLKLDKDGEALKKELKNWTNIQGLYNTALFVPYVAVDKPPTRNGWSAIALVFAEGSIPLRTWLRDPSSARHVAPLMTRLFLDRGLTAGYRPTLPIAHAHPMHKLRLPAFRRIRVRIAINRIMPSLRHIHPQLAPIPDLIEIMHGFVRNATISSILLTDVPVALKTVEAHGDLHGGNILVSADEHPMPMIVDLAEFGDHHWATDVARLVADLLLRSVDTESEWYSWNRFELWRTLAGAAGQLRPPESTPDPHNAGVFAALTWLAEHHRDVLMYISDPEHAWEWHVALAEQLLRGTYNPNLSDPKRALALIAAYDQLMCAKEIVPKGPGRF